MKKLIPLLLVIFCLAGCGKSGDYEKAMELYNGGDYAAAAEAFEKLQDYEDSRQMLQASLYGLACQQMESGDYASAVEGFKELGTYQDSLQMLQACLAQQDPFGTILEYYKANGHYTNGWYLDGQHNFAGDGAYLIGATEEDELLMAFVSDDETATTSIYLSRDGSITMIVLIRTGEEAVRGVIEMNASEYQYGQELKNFRYEATGTRWSYASFEARANNYIRNTLLYADFRIGLLDLEVSLSKMGFDNYVGPDGVITEIVTDDMIAGMWESCNTEGWKTRLYLTGDQVYKCNYNPSGQAPTAEYMLASPDSFLLSDGMKVSDYDPVIGMKIVLDENVTKYSAYADTYRRYIWYGDDGKLYMRVESVEQGLGAEADGMYFLKIADDTPTSINPGKIKEDEGSSDSGASNQPAVDISRATAGQRNALEKAISYLNVMPFSYEGLIEQLEYEGYSQSDAKFGADYCGADWYEQAVLKAKAYLRTTAFSFDGLVDQLEYEGFTADEAKFGAENCEADWYLQAVRCAENYLDIFDFSRSELIDQLEYEGFTHDQALYAAEECY